MDKISGIVAPSPRVTTVDMTNAPGVRTTQPNSDRSVGAMSHLAENTPGTPAWKSKEARQASLVTKVSNSFFMKAKPVSEEATNEKEISVPRELHAQQPDGLFPKGSFIDRSA